MQWFIKEQVEEVATMSDLLRVVERSRDDVMEIENYMAREQSGGEGSDLDRAQARRGLSRSAELRAAAADVLGRVARAPLRARVGDGTLDEAAFRGTSARTTCS